MGTKKSEKYFLPILTSQNNRNKGGNLQLLLMLKTRTRNTAAATHNQFKWKENLLFSIGFSFQSINQQFGSPETCCLSLGIDRSQRREGQFGHLLHGHAYNGNIFGDK